MSPVTYVLGFYITEDDILHSHRREDLKSYIYAIAPIYVLVSLVMTTFQVFMSQSAVVSKVVFLGILHLII
jgi:hypothetical protein